MEPVHPMLMDFFHRSAVLNLPHELREIYQFIESKENQLEDISLTEQQFLHQMIKRSPIKEAAAQFSLTISAVKEIMDEAQAEIDHVVKEKCARVKWIDCTVRSKKQHRKNDTQRMFIFVC